MAEDQNNNSTVQAVGNVQNGQDQAQTVKAGEGNLGQINREFQEKSVLKQAHELGIPYINIGKTPLNPDFLKLVDYETAQNSRVIPFFRVGKKVRLAVEKPDTPETQKVIEDLKSKDYEVEVNLASHAGIDDALKIYSSTQQYKKPDIVEKVQEESIETYEKEISNLAEMADKLDTVVAEEALNMVNIGAMKTGASDVHYEPEEKTVIVRFRIDGMLHKVFEIKPATYRNLANQIKYKSKMQLNINSVPQDGRYDFVFNDKKIDVRVSSIPTPYGESFVCRFLIPQTKFIRFDYLGFQGNTLKKLEKSSKISHGMILSTGPTGSGKTTTLYSILHKLNTPENKIITLEDPVEYHVNGVTQSQVNEKRGYNFATGLKAVLRQDPDTIMVGEIRDLDTAETAAQAALTGHILLSTLHTNNALEAVPRLVNMGLPRYMVASALDTVIAQRLVRRVCSKCSTMEPITEAERQEYEEVFGNLKKINPNLNLNIPTELPRVHGCEHCSNTGYKGRIVIAEILVMDQQMKRLILEDASSVDLISEARKQNFITMREDGLIKVAQGLTTLEEVHRVSTISKKEE